MQSNNTAEQVAYNHDWDTVHALFLLLVIFVAVSGNAFVCAAVARYRRLQRPSNYFLVSLAASDILVALFSLPFRAYFEINATWQLGKHTCQFWIFVDLLCSSASIVNLSLISVDRYISLSRPLRYLVLMTTQRCRIGIFAVWLFSFTVSILSLHNWSSDGTLEYEVMCRKIDKVYYTASTILAILIPLTMLIVLYYLVFKMALEQQRKISQSTTTGNSFSQDGTINNPSQTHHHRRNFLRVELKAAKTLIIVVGTFLICWLPLFCMMLILQYSPKHFEGLPLRTQTILGTLFVNTLPYLNSALNPFIYTYFNSDFRKVFKDTFLTYLTCAKNRAEVNTESDARL
uniref:Orphan G protein-coupled receptor Ren 1 n=1 Tax=Renilla koellikeri TaxID=6135 RepID=Q8MTW3_RENKO|nr:orphan G protein-coupled receptor Ren 1 [Renilla koellikeri]